jgi:hypothetical protein
MSLLDQGEDQLKRAPQPPALRTRMTGLLMGAGAAFLFACPCLAGQARVPAEASLVSELPSNPDRGFLVSMDRSRTATLPLPGSGPIAFPADGDTPALVPLPPPVWAGLGILGALAYSRHKNRRRYRAA